MKLTSGIIKNFIPLLLIICFTSCLENKGSKIKNRAAELPRTDVDFDDIKLDFDKWWEYHNNNISLSSEFIALNDSSEVISKNDFLKSLTTGNYIPLKLVRSDSLTKYMLFKLDSFTEKNIRTVIKNTSTVIYSHFKMEGTDFPKFSFIDLNGREYNNDNTIGKTLIIKCWFINCAPCIAEFPELNRMVEGYINSEDILFIGLAMDSKKDLENFLSKKTFKYETIPNQKEFMAKALSVQQYPTHFVVNKEGKIEKVVNKSSELISYLNGGQKQIMEEKKNLPPPPPGPAK